jgi:DNA gyrase subunit A
VDKIVEAAKNGRIVGVNDVIDNTSKEGIRIVIELKRGQSRDVVLNQLFKYTPLEYNYSIINLALVRGRPRILNLRQLLEQYLDHRRDVIVRRTRFQLAEAEAESHRLEGLLVAIDHIDDIISIIRNSKDAESARTKLMEKYEFTHRQATHILNMTLRTLTGMARERLREEYATVQDQIRDYQDILTNEVRVLEIMKEDLFELKERYGDTRRTLIVGEAGELSLEDLVADEVMAVTVTNKGYIKREPLSSYRVQARGGKGIIGTRSRDETDFPQHLFVASTHDYLLFFTNDGRVYWQKVYDIPQLGRMAQGRAIVNLLELGADQHVVSIVPVENFDDDASICMVSRGGYVKKCGLKEYSHPRRGGIATMKIAEGDEMLAALLVNRGQEIVLATRLGMAVRFDEAVVRDMGRTARGLKGPALAEGDRIVSAVVGQPGDYLLTVCERGIGKRTQIDEYRKTKSQRSRGVINIRITEKNGPVVAVLPVQEGDELMVMTETGKVIRTPVEDVRETGRAAVGVILVNLGDNDRVTAVARVAHDDAESAHEHAEALKLEAQEEAERLGRGRSNGNGSAPDTPAGEAGSVEVHGERVDAKDQAPASQGAETEGAGAAEEADGDGDPETTGADTTPAAEGDGPNTGRAATSEDGEPPEPPAAAPGDEAVPAGERPDQVNELLRRAEKEADDDRQEGPEEEPNKSDPEQA